MQMTVRSSSQCRCRLGVAIRERRRAIGLSQELLAERIDCHRNYVGTNERGEQNVTFDMLVRFARALETSLGKIITSTKL